jgi:hypothetical protein
VERISAWAAALLLVFEPISGASQEAIKKAEPAATAIPTQNFQDALLDHMTGKWKLTGVFEGQPVHHSVDAAWVLNHQFLRIHEKDLGTAKPGEVLYEATVFIGYEPSTKRYVAHWIDVFGGGAGTMGYGKLNGSAIEFLFDYPGQPWRTTFRWQPEAKSWQWLMQAKTKDDRWTEAANMKLSHNQAP